MRGLPVGSGRPRDFFWCHRWESNPLAVSYTAPQTGGGCHADRRYDGKNGAPRWTRTINLPLRGRSLSPLSYRRLVPAGGVEPTTPSVMSRAHVRRAVRAITFFFTPHCHLSFRGQPRAHRHEALDVTENPCGVSNHSSRRLALLLRLSRCNVGAVTPKACPCHAVCVACLLPRMAAGATYVAWQLPSCRGTFSRGKHLGAAYEVPGFPSGGATRSETPVS